MEVFRISSEKYSKKLSASGAANRWNEEGQYVIYTGSSRSLSTLELLVHRANIKPTIKYKLLVIEIDVSKRNIQIINPKALDKAWRKISQYSKLQEIGSKWYQAEKQLILEVPSSVIPQESNYVINANHPDFRKKVKIKKLEDFFWDGRLL